MDAAAWRIACAVGVAMGWTGLIGSRLLAGVPAEHLADQGTLRLLDRAKRHAGAKQWQQAARRYRQLLLDCPGKLVKIADGHYRSMRRVCSDRLRAMPPGAFPRRQPPAAPVVTRQFNDAIRRADEHALARIAGDFFWNPYAHTALDRLGELHLARGAFGRAVQAWACLLDLAPHADVGVPTVLAKMAFAYHELGDTSASYGLLERLRRSHAQARAVIGGRRQLLTAFLDAMMRDGSTDRGSAGDWPTWGGAFARSAHGSAFRGFGKVLWRYPASGGTDVVVSDRLAIYGHDGSLLARDLDSGRLRWRCRLGRAHAVPGWRVSPSVAHGLVLVRVAEPVEGGGLRTRIVGIDLGTGKRAFQHACPPVAKGGSYVFAPSPVASDGVLWTSAVVTRGDELACWLRAVDLDGRRLIWQVKLAETREPVTAGLGPAPVGVFGHMVFVNTGLGVVGAVDTRYGEVAWTRSCAQPGRRAADAVAGPPVVTDGVVHVVPPASGTVLAFDPGSGRRQWTQTVPQARYLVGTHRSRVVTVGTTAVAVASRGGKVLWRRRVPGGQPVGRPVMAGDSVLIPTKETLSIVSVSGGRSRRTAAWPTGTSGRRVLCCGPVVLVVGRDGLTAVRNEQTKE